MVAFAHAHAAVDAGENIVAVLNPDMIAWDADDDPILWLHTIRRMTHAGYTADKAIAGANLPTLQAAPADHSPVNSAMPRNCHRMSVLTRLPLSDCLQSDILNSLTIQSFCNGG